jgi:hypothetical protein
MNAKIYIAIFVSTFVALSIITVSFNYLVDPFLIFNSARIDYFNQKKNDINDQIRITKVYHPAYEKWDVILIGNSRIEMGLDPDHVCFQQDQQKVYNLGIPGASVPQQLEYALNILYEQPVKKVFLSIDFVDFLVPVNKAPNGTTFKISDTPINKSHHYKFNGESNPLSLRSEFMDKYRSLFSLDALISSFKTVTLQSRLTTDRTGKGFNPADDFKASIQAEGVPAIFEQKMQSLNKRFSNDWSLYYSDSSPSLASLYLIEFLKISNERGVEVVIFTNPFHQSFWDLLKEKNLFRLHQEWLMLLSKTLIEMNLEKTSFWDFSVDSIYIHEPLPLPGAGKKYQPLNWFWEPSHYRKELGDLMIESMLHAQCGKSVIFGEKVF